MFTPAVARRLGF